MCLRVCVRARPPVMFAHEKAVISVNNQHGILPQVVLVECVEDSPERHVTHREERRVHALDVSDLLWVLRARVCVCVCVCVSEREINGQPASQPASQPDRQTDRQAGRQAGRQTAEERTSATERYGGQSKSGPS
eukprot:COSAG03_NODE_2992_length_2304_cov_14.871655_2_plen_134_part_00